MTESEQTNFVDFEIEDQNIELSHCSCCGKSFGISIYANLAIKFCCYGEKTEEKCSFYTEKADLKLDKEGRCMEKGCRLTKIKNFEEIQDESVNKSLQIIEEILENHDQVMIVVSGYYKVETKVMLKLVESRRFMVTHKIFDGTDRVFTLYPR